MILTTVASRRFAIKTVVISNHLIAITGVNLKRGLLFLEQMGYNQTSHLMVQKTNINDEL